MPHFFRSLVPRLRSYARNINGLESSIKLYTIEAVLIGLVVAIINNNNNLFANRLGANDYQLGLLSLSAQLVNVVVLLPGAIFTDALKTKRGMVIGSIGLTGVIYVAIGFISGFGAWRLYAFIGLTAISSGAMTVYNLSWQSFFPEVIPIQRRNITLTLKNYMAVTVGIITPLITGTILTSLRTNEQKINGHQTFFFVAAALIAVQILVIRRLNPTRPGTSAGVNFAAVKETFNRLTHNKSFIIYAAVALFFYISWQIDWTLYYITQTQYLLLNEVKLGLVQIFGAGAQLLTLSFWSRMNERRGVVFTMTFGILSLCVNSIAVIVSTSLPPPFNQIIFFVLHTTANLGFVTVALNIFQCTLQVVDDKYKTLSISLFTVLTSLSNAIMPLAGIALYKALGGDSSALKWAFAIFLALRLSAAGLWLLRCKKS